MTHLSSEDETDDNQQVRGESSSLATSSPTQVRDEVLSYQTRLLAELSEAADSYVRRNIFTERQERKAWNTVRKEIAALTDFMAFLNQVEQVSRDQKQDTERSILVLHLAEEPRLWTAITFGLVKLFLAWGQQQGYAIKTINDHLDVIKLYARLAQQAGFQTADQMLAIKHIARIRGAEAERIDAVRTQTRRGQKKDALPQLATRSFPRCATAGQEPEKWTTRRACAARSTGGRGGETRGRRPSSPNRALYAKLQPPSLVEQASRQEAGIDKTTWTPPMTTRGLREHLHELGLDIAQELYGDDEKVLSRPRPQRPALEKQINLTSYDGRHEWTRNAILGGSNPIAVTKAGGWKGHSAMVERYYGELDIINEDIVLAR